MSKGLTLTLRGRGERVFNVDDPLWVSRAGIEPPRWLPAGAVADSDYLGIAYGATWMCTPPELPKPAPRPLYGSEKRIMVPARLNDELAFFLGAYLSEGHRNRSNWTVVITNSVDAVLERVQMTCQSVFGMPGRIVRQPGKCPAFIVSSKRLIEFLDLLGCGSRASDKQVPEVMYSANKSAPLSFLQGVALDAYTTYQWAGKWGLCLESRLAIDQIQDLLTLLGIANAQVPKFNKQMGKTYYELYAAGPWGQRLVQMVPFLEPDKAARAAGYLARPYRTAGTDLVPGITGPELYDLIPRGLSGRRGKGSGRQAFRHLVDPRTAKVTRASVECARGAGAALPPWLVEVLETPIRFVEVLGASFVENTVCASLRHSRRKHVPSTAPD